MNNESCRDKISINTEVDKYVDAHTYYSVKK